MSGELVPVKKPRKDLRVRHPDNEAMLTKIQEMSLEPMMGILTDALCQSPSAAAWGKLAEKSPGAWTTAVAQMHKLVFPQVSISVVKNVSEMSDRDLDVLIEQKARDLNNTMDAEFSTLTDESVTDTPE